MKMASLVQEAPGLYGNVRIEEEIIQWIWNEKLLLLDDLRTECGKKLILQKSGHWNRAEEGPDFRESSLCIDGMEQQGDVEVHFHARDWKAHGHHRDPAYNSVILHVLLFPSRNPAYTRSETGKPIPHLVLLPYLLQGIEEYAEEWAIRKLSGEDPFSSSHEKPKHLSDQCIELSKKRWVGKVNFAQNRIARNSWSEACHQWFLEVLGFPRNQANMHRLALRYPLKHWREGIDVEKLYAQIAGWKTKGMRPANFPILRLSQYAEFAQLRPNWPELLATCDFSSLIPVEEGSRKALGLTKRSQDWRLDFLGSVFGAKRSNTLLVDCCLPLWSAKNNRDGFALWHHWPAGDFPQKFFDLASKWGLWEKGKGVSNGDLQAILMHFLLDEESE